MKQGQTKFRQEQGIFEFECAQIEELLPENLDEMVNAMLRFGSHRPIAVIGRVDRAVLRVPMSVPAFWLNLVRRTDLTLSAIAVVTHSPVVRLTAKGFAAANRALKRSTQFGVFEETMDALDWARMLLRTVPVSAAVQG
jgi:hypothetical protein